MSEVTSVENALESLKTAVAPVVASYDDAAKASAEERDAEIALVGKILALVRPAVRALGTRPEIASSWYVLRGDDKTERAPWRGLILTCAPNKVGPSRRHGRDENTGDYEGSDVFLRDDGELIMLTYSGTWSNWQNDRSEWTATERVLPVAEFVEGWTAGKPEHLLKHLGELISKAGDRTERAAAARERAEKLRAMLALIG